MTLLQCSAIVKAHLCFAGAGHCLCTVHSIGALAQDIAAHAADAGVFRGFVCLYIQTICIWSQGGYIAFQYFMDLDGFSLDIWISGYMDTWMWAIPFFDVKGNGWKDLVT